MNYIKDLLIPAHISPSLSKLNKLTYLNKLTTMKSWQVNQK